VLVEKRLLMPASHLVVEAGMVRRRAQAGLDEPRRERLHLAARRAVDDARFAVMAREDVGQLAMQVAAPQDAIGQVRTIERSDEQERLGEPELGGDVAADALR